MKKILLIAALLTVSSSAFAQAEANPEEYGPGTHGVMFGGWFAPMFLFQQTGNGAQMASYVNALKIYAGWTGTYASVYVRGKNTTIVKLYAKDMDGKTAANYLDLDIAFLKVNTASKAVNLTVGRKYYTLGSGFVLNGRGDGGQIDLYTPAGDLTAFGMLTNYLRKEANPYRLNDKDYADGTERLFTGGQYSYTVYNQTAYAFVLIQQDKKSGITDAEKYDSQHYALGLNGLITDRFKYTAEGIMEKGKAYDVAAGKETDINAKAALVVMDYYVKHKLYPAINLQYSYASGDSDRLDYTKASNSSGEDNGFMQFGSFNGGYALRPAPGNMHVIRGGFSLAPFTDGTSMLKRSTYSLKYTAYLKDKTESYIDQSYAGGNSRYVGSGIDFMIRWKIYSDLSAYFMSAVFIPGSAYSVNDKVQNLSMAGLNLSF